MISKILTDRGFVNFDNGEQSGTHWTCFIIKNKKSYYFDSFGGNPDNCLLKQLPKPIIYPNFKIQNINSFLCGTYTLNIWIQNLDKFLNWNHYIW